MVELKKGITAPQLQKKLKRFRILFRDCSNFAFLDSSFARFAVRNKADITKLKEALDA
jgi:threonine-phosphate decarboxylase